LIVALERTIKYVAERFYKPWLVRYLAVTRKYVYRGIRLEIPPGVFHPGFFFSSKFLLRWLARQPLEGRSFLELGAGSGLISLFAAGRGAVVTATDISPVAIQCLQKNRELNSAAMEIIHSDLYTSIPQQSYDVIAVNPPFYRKHPGSDAEKAWYCGADGEYFDVFFGGLAGYSHSRTDVWMVLCAGCDLDLISGLAARHGWALECVRTRRNIIERDYIFRIVRQAGGILWN
jgi:release factor glutamine methyltransferase